MSENRKRDQTLTIRLTRKEKEIIVRKAAKARMTVTDFLVAAVNRAEIHVAEDTRPLVTQLKHIGNNLNQITMKINAGAFRSYNFQELIDMQKQIYAELYRLNRGEPWRP